MYVCVFVYIYIHIYVCVYMLKYLIIIYTVLRVMRTCTRYAYFVINFFIDVGLAMQFHSIFSWVEVGHHPPEACSFKSASFLVVLERLRETELDLSKLQYQRALNLGLRVPRACEA